MKLLAATGEYDVLITELGGTVGDIESLPYIESVRQMKWELGPSNCLVIHLTLLPYLSAAGELKTKPTQHSVKELAKNGIQPDLLVCRTEHPMTDDIRRKLALFCNVDENAVIECADAETIYAVPLRLQAEKIDTIVLEKLRLKNNKKPDLARWKRFIKRQKNPKHQVNIALVGKYIELQDAYKSILEAFIHAGAHNECKIKVHSIHSESIDADNAAEIFKNIDGVLVAPGFGDRGVEGKINAIKYVRENNIPFFGICLGMQCAVIEFARNVLGKDEAHSTEMDKNTNYPIIDLMEAQKQITKMGGTMRLGAYDCKIKPKTNTFIAYGSELISERHRHRYEFNNQYLTDFEANGFNAVGKNTESNLVEIMELQNHPWFVGVQFHPELKSRVVSPHPLFKAFVKASLKHKTTKASKVVKHMIKS